VVDKGVEQETARHQVDRAASLNDVAIRKPCYVKNMQDIDGGENLQMPLLTGRISVNLARC